VSQAALTIRGKPLSSLLSHSSHHFGRHAGGPSELQHPRANCRLPIGKWSRRPVGAPLVVAPRPPELRWASLKPSLLSAQGRRMTWTETRRSSVLILAAVAAVLTLRKQGDARLTGALVNGSHREVGRSATSRPCYPARLLSWCARPMASFSPPGSAIPGLISNKLNQVSQFKPEGR